VHSSLNSYVCQDLQDVLQTFSDGFGHYIAKTSDFKNFVTYKLVSASFKNMTTNSSYDRLLTFVQAPMLGPGLAFTKSFKK